MKQETQKRIQHVTPPVKNILRALGVGLAELRERTGYSMGHLSQAINGKLDSHRVRFAVYCAVRPLAKRLLRLDVTMDSLWSQEDAA